MKLDPTDRRILAILQRDGRRQNTELAHDVGLSPSPCLRRVKLLEEKGVIDRYVALLNPARIGMNFTVFVRVTLDRQDKVTVEQFASEMHKLPLVLECYLMAGEYDFLLRVVAADLEAFRQFLLNQLTPLAGVRNVQTEIPLRTVKQTTHYPL